MLKTLEEPPEYLKFVLATTDPQKVPATVLSRCLQFNLRPMAPRDGARASRRACCDRGASPPSRGALRLIARAARGSMRDALSLTDQAIAFGSGALSKSRRARRCSAAVDRGHAVRLRRGAGARATARRWSRPSTALRELGLSAAGTLEEMAALLQQMAVLQAVPGALDDDDPDSRGRARLAALLPRRRDAAALQHRACTAAPSWRSRPTNTAAS